MFETYKFVQNFVEFKARSLQVEGWDGQVSIGHTNPQSN